MKRLFQVVPFPNSDPVYFESKKAAKIFRDEQGDCHVSRGPDHMGRHGHKKLATMRSQPKHTKGV